jgi:hypothetical protein
MVYVSHTRVPLANLVKLNWGLLPESPSPPIWVTDASSEHNSANILGYRLTIQIKQLSARLLCAYSSTSKMEAVRPFESYQITRRRILNRKSLCQEQWQDRLFKAQAVD